MQLEQMERTGSMPNEFKNQRFLSVFEAESRTGRKASTWRADILKRRIPYVKIGRSVRIPESVIDDLIRSGYRPAVEVTA